MKLSKIFFGTYNSYVMDALNLNLVFILMTVANEPLCKYGFDMKHKPLHSSKIFPRTY